MVNSSNPSKDRVTLQSCYSLHEASQKPNHRRNTLPPTTFTGEIFRRPPFRPKSTPTGVSPSDLPFNGSFVKKYLPTCPHVPISGRALKFTHRLVVVRGGHMCLHHMEARETLFRHVPPLAGASATEKPIHPLHTPHRRRKSPSFSLFLSGHCFCIFLSPKSPLFLCFLRLYGVFRTLGVVSTDSY